jgi:hypothetical protein
MKPLIESDFICDIWIEVHLFSFNKKNTKNKLIFLLEFVLPVIPFFRQNSPA